MLCCPVAARLFHEWSWIAFKILRCTTCSASSQSLLYRADASHLDLDKVLAFGLNSGCSAETCRMCLKHLFCLENLVEAISYSGKKRIRARRVDEDVHLGVDAASGRPWGASAFSLEVFERKWGTGKERTPATNDH